MLIRVVAAALLIMCLADTTFGADKVVVWPQPVQMALSAKHDYPSLVTFVTKTGNAPTPKQKVRIRVVDTDLLLYENGKEADKASSEVVATTGDHGEGSISVVTVNDVTATLQFTAVDEKGEAAKTSTLLAIPSALYEGDFFSRRVFTEVFTGATFTNDYDTSGANIGFQDTSPLLRATFDTVWPGYNRFGRPWYDRSLFHTGMELEFSSFPFGPSVTGAAKRQSESNAQAADTTTSKGLDNAFSGSVYLLWQPDKLGSYTDTSTRPGVPFDAMRWGFFGKAGTTSRTNALANGTNSIHRYQVGIKFTHHQTIQNDPVREQDNITPMRFIEISYGHFDEYAGRPHARRLVIDGGFRLPGLGSNLIPFYAGLHYNTGGGPDDLRLFLGFLFKLNEIANVFAKYNREHP